MSRHYERGIAQSQETVAQIGQRPEGTEPMLTHEIESFVKGFGLSTKAAQQIINRWLADAGQNHQAGWAEGYDSASEYYTE